MSNTLSVRDLCERYAVTEHTVLGWIRTGELRAVNVGRNSARKPRWRITQESMAAFEQLRTPTPPLPRTQRRKRAPEVIQFYK